MTGVERRLEGLELQHRTFAGMNGALDSMIEVS
jgi:hypothetical protein